MLALAFGCDPVALVYAAALAAAAPLLAHARFRSEPDAGVADGLRAVFPVAAAAAAWAFLEWRFTGGAFATIIDQGTLFHFSDGVVHGLGIAVRDTASTALHAPVYLVVGALLFLRKPIAVAGYAPSPGRARRRAVDRPAVLDGDSLHAPRRLAIVTAPARPGRSATRVLFAAAVLQIVIGVVATSHTADVSRFLHVLW